MLRAFATVIAYAAVCAFLVLIGSQAGTARGESGRLLTDTRSALNADYSTAAVLPILSALKPEIVEAAARDNAALGQEDLVLSREGSARQEPRALAPQQVAPAGPAELGPLADERTAAAPSPPAAAGEASSRERSGLPMAPVLAVLLVSTCLVWGAYYALRPRSD